jgi:hypothetical protein
MQKAKAQSAMRPPFLALAFIFVTAVILLALLLPPRASHAQGIVRGAQQGSYEGSRVAGPVGGIVGTSVLGGREEDICSRLVFFSLTQKRNGRSNVAPET